MDRNSLKDFVDIQIPFEGDKTLGISDPSQIPKRNAWISQKRKTLQDSGNELKEPDPFSKQTYRWRHTSRFQQSSVSI